jgi:hypothetical protein
MAGSGRIVPGSSTRFGRVPPAIYLIAALAGVAAILGALAVVTPWYQSAGVLHQTGINTSYTQNYVPGNGGVFNTCTQYITSNYTQCGVLYYTYSSGNGTQLLANLYLLIFGASVAVAVLGAASAATIASGLGGKIRGRRLQVLVVVLLATALGVCAVSATALPLLQSRALGDSGQCADYPSSMSPCSTFIGSAGSVGCTKGSCLETNLTWHPTTGWYESLGALALLAGALVVLRAQPLVGACPSCGGPNVWTAKFCDRCGSSLPLGKPAPPPRMRI